MTTIMMEIIKQVRETIEVPLPLYLYSYVGDEGGPYRFTHTWYKICHDEDGMNLVIDTLNWYENSLGPGYSLNRLVSKDKMMFNRLYDAMLAEKLTAISAYDYNAEVKKAILAMIETHTKCDLRDVRGAFKQ